MSALDARIRKLAREEAEALTGAPPATGLETTGPDRLAALEKEVADLRARLEQMEKTATASPSPARRAARKESGDKHTE